MLEALQHLLSEHKTAAWWLAAASAGLLLLSLVSLPLIAMLLPVDFIPRRLKPRPTHDASGPPAPARINLVRLLGRVAKNLVGGLLAVAGLAMLVLPGQGLLTLALALLLLDLPGKRKLEARLLRSRRFQHWINRLRQRLGRPPLLPG